jgi:uncharacterized protein (UPF0335 family)
MLDSADIKQPTGASACSIYAHLVGGIRQEGSYPHNADDWGRCERFLTKAVLHPQLHRMAEVNAYWKALVERWDEIAACDDSGKTKLIKEIVRPIQKADPHHVSMGPNASMTVGPITFKGADGSPDTDEELFQRAVMLVWEEKVASTSFIQRRLGIGYNQAARLIERMEELAIVSKADHAGKREVRDPADLRAALGIKDAVNTIAEGDEAKAVVLFDTIVKSMKAADDELRKKQGKPPMKPDPTFDAARDSAFAVTADELRQFIERFEQLEAEKKDVAEQQKELMQEAKARGYDTKVLRKVVALRKRKPDEIAEEEAVLEMYRAALGMV